MKQDRFDCFPDLVGRWIVWDCRRGRVAKLNRRELIELSRQEAQGLSALLNGRDSRLSAERGGKGGPRSSQVAERGEKARRLP